MRLVLSLAMLLARAAQPEATAVLAGRVSVAYGALPADARVVAECRGDPAVVRTAAVGERGEFLIEDLPPGPCRVHAEAAGCDPGTDAEVTVESGQERRVEVALVPQRRATSGPGWRVSVRRGPEGALPLPSRTVDAVAALGLFFDGARDPSGRENEYVLDGFSVSDPLAGGLGADVPLLALAALSVTSAARAAGQAWTPGATIDLIANAGSNRWDLDGLATRPGARDAAVTEAAVAWRLPIVKDHLWAAATAEGRWLDGESEPRGLARLSWQAGSRDKLTVTALDTRSATRARLLGARWERLFTDNVIGRAQAAWRWQRDGADDASGWQGTLSLTWWSGDRSDHGLTLEARHEALEAHFDGSPGHFPGARTLISLEDSWRPGRSLTITPGVAYVRGAFSAPLPSLERRRLAVAGPTPHLGVAWDATDDGRTVVRASASGALAAGSYARTRVAETPAVRAWDVAAGVEREIASGVTLAADAVQRWRAAERYRGMIVALKQREGRAAYSLAYLRQSTPGAPHAARATIGYLLFWGLSAGATALTGALPDGGAGWQLAGRLDWSLSPLIGQAISLWLDAFRLQADHHTTADLRLGLAWSL